MCWYYYSLEEKKIPQCFEWMALLAIFLVVDFPFGIGFEFGVAAVDLFLRRDILGNLSSNPSPALRPGIRCTCNFVIADAVAAAGPRFVIAAAVVAGG